MKISVIIPVYNAEKYLSKCLDSIKNQTFKDWEVIAVDDGSTDNSYSILSDYSFQDKRFKVFSQKNQGPGMARNNAIKHVVGDYIVFIDSDDYVENYYFEHLIKKVLEDNSDVVFIDVIRESPEGEIIKYQTLSKYKKYSKEKIIRHQLTGKLPWGGWRKAVRTSLINNNNIRYTKDEVGEEALFSFRVLYHAEVISFVEETCYHYVDHPNSQSTKGEEDPWGEVCINMMSFLQQKGILHDYQTTINSFGYTALIVSIYRITQNHKLSDAIRKSKIRLKKFRKNYTFDLDKDSLEIRTRSLVFFAKMGFVLPIVLIAKLKSLL